MLPRPFAPLLILLAVFCTSCQSPRPAGDRARQPVEPPTIASIQQEPPIRVRIVAGDPSVTLASTGPLTIGPIESQRAMAQSRSFASPVTISRQGGRFMIAGGGTTIAWGLPVLAIRSADGSAIRVNDGTYPGSLRIWPVMLRSGQASNLFDVVNHVPMEQYLPGVLERELYPKWPAETFVAQAIAARTYAIAEKALSKGRHYDLASTTASQVYGGQGTNPSAIDAVRRTRGQVIAYQGRIVPAYFSSTSGGIGQDAVAAFPDSPWVVDIAPLRGRTHQWGTSSNHYHWGPLARRTSTLSRRIAAWGRAEKNPVAAIDTLARVQVTRRSSTGRPAVFRLTDRRNRSFDLPAEWFRFACNYGGGGLGSLDLSQQLKSSNVDVTIQGDRVVFRNGRGFGHGVGMCQWSARDMAEAGWKGRSIVEFFYPGARVTRAY